MTVHTEDLIYFVIYEYEQNVYKNNDLSTTTKYVRFQRILNFVYQADFIFHKLATINLEMLPLSCGS